MGNKWPRRARSAIRAVSLGMVYITCVLDLHGLGNFGLNQDQLAYTGWNHKRGHRVLKILDQWI